MQNFVVSLKSLVYIVRCPFITPLQDTPPAKRKRSMSGYNMFMSEAMKEDGDVGQGV